MRGLAKFHVVLRTLAIHRANILKSEDMHPGMMEYWQYARYSKEYHTSSVLTLCSVALLRRLTNKP